MTNIDKNTEKKKFDKIINDIETVLDCGFKVPPFGAVVSAKEIRKQLTTLKKAVNDAVEEAEHIMNIKDKIVADARAESEEMLRRRQLEIAKQPVLKEAENIAKKMLLQAKEESEKMVRQAKDFQVEVKERTYRYAEMIFDEVEKGLNENRKRVSRDRQGLKSLVEDANKSEQGQDQAVQQQQRKLS